MVILMMKMTERCYIDKSDSWWNLIDKKGKLNLDGSLTVQSVMEDICNEVNKQEERNIKLSENLKQKTWELHVRVNETARVMEEKDKQIKQLEKELSEMQDKAFDYGESLIWEMSSDISNETDELRIEIYGKEKAEQLKQQQIEEDKKLYSRKATIDDITPVWKIYLPEHMPLTPKKTEKVCRNCTHHDYDEFNLDDGGFVEYEVCRKHHDLDNGPCEEWEEL